MKNKNSKLEKAFAKEIAEVKAKIKEHLENADRELQKAITLSDKNNIPFSSAVSQIPQAYIPDSFDLDDFSRKLNPDDSEENFDEYEAFERLFDASYHGNVGWKHSDVCY